MTVVSICSSSVIGQVIGHGVEAALLQFPALLPMRPTLEEIAEVHEELNHIERLAGDLSRRLDELGYELADRMENAA